MKSKWVPLLAGIFFVSSSLAAQDEAAMVEDIIARVNNEIITFSDLERAQKLLRDEVAQDCRGCPQSQLDAMYKDREKNALRDLIDQSLLVQRAKDLGFNVEPEVVKRLDQVRQQNNLPSMEELEKMASAQGISFEDFKANIRNNLLTQEVIRREVGSRVIIGRDEVRKYYEEHKSDFNRPEQVYLEEIFVSTEGKSEAEIPALEKKANTLLGRVKNGEEFTELAKRYSDGSTAKQGGELGAFERGQLAKEVEDAVFKLKRGEMTGVIRTKTGFLTLKVVEHFDAGMQPLEKVEPEITSRLYYDKIQPALRDYLAKLREDSYVVVKPGYTDSAGIASTPILEVAPTPDEGKGKKGKKGKKSKKAEG